MIRLTAPIATLAAALLLAGCTEDLSPQRARFDGLASGWEQKLDGLNATGSEQEQKITELSNTVGTDDTENAAQIAASLRSSVANDKVNREVVATAIARNRESVSRAMQSGKAADAKAAVDASEAEMNALLSAITQMAQTRGAELEAFGVAIGKKLNGRVGA
jgi:uncharacterized coiled-coil protein SlyX